MACRDCGSDLERPGDYCLVCRSPNADTVVLECARDRTTVTALFEDAVVAERTVTTRPETADRLASTELRNYAGRIVDDVRRKRPEAVYAAGDRDVMRAVRRDLHYPFYRVAASDPVAAVRRRRSEPALEVVEASLSEKLGGSHSTVIGGRDGRRVLDAVAAHPHVKKIVPGPIDAGSASGGGVRAKATRADDRGNVRLLLRDGSSVQENRVVTTAGDRERGEAVRGDLQEALADAGYGT